MFDMDASKLIYIQIADWIETEIIDRTLKPDEKVHSQYQLAELFNINPATAGKGLTLLLEAKILYKRRGLGTFVAPDGREKLLAKRKEETLRKLITKLLDEARLLDVDDNQLLSMIEAERDRKKEGLL
ncbi:GntR family transcriptional regulator [Sporosarcina limicola]|uniref:DNA-binding transcriptional regulator YhcF (GntR family) n=1 Tax=Sporosarcina limicola TaxID=34101 RepID=A0A927MKV9_9BACL|nr:GntR family transcriptional regulator [Sporosarcina limicola]MBE1555771.1 DNA-binding transcriptional regulator YhcF (GntR family) [Sporosarcina limicola]